MLTGVLAKMYELKDGAGFHVGRFSLSLWEEILQYGAARGAIAASSLGCINNISRDYVAEFLQQNARLNA